MNLSAEPFDQAAHTDSMRRAEFSEIGEYDGLGAREEKLSRCCRLCWAVLRAARVSTGLCT